MRFMKITYDKKTDIADIKFQKGKYHVSEEVGEGVIVDYTRSGKIIGIEILDVSKRMPHKAAREIMHLQAASV